MNNDLISRSALLDCIGDVGNDPEDDTTFLTIGQACAIAHKSIVDMVKAAPAVDPETLRPTGRWEEEDERSAYYGRLVSCSECGGLLETHKKQYFKYCYNCGAKMEG